MSVTPLPPEEEAATATPEQSNQLQDVARRIVRGPYAPLAAGAALAAIGVLLAVLALVGAIGGGSDNAVKLYEGTPATAADAGTWRSVDPSAVTLKSATAPSGRKAVEATLGSGRTSFTALQWTFTKSQDFFGHRWLFLTFQGRATGQMYTFFLDFNSNHRNSAGYTIVDTSNQWRAVPLDLSKPTLGKGRFDLRHVISVRVTTDSKDQTGTFAVGRLTLSPSP